MVRSRLAFQCRLLGWGFEYWARCTVNHARRRLRGLPVDRRDYRITRRVLAHVLGLRRLRYVTYGQQAWEGAGSQLFFMICARNLARGLGVPYAHKPFAALPHSEGEAEDFARRWEECFGFGRGELRLDQARGTGLDVLELNESDLWCPKFIAWLTSLVPAEAADLRARFRQGRPPRPGGPLRVAVHVRRGDVSAECHSHMWTPLGQVRATAEAIIARLAARGMAYELFVVSQGRPEDFAELEGLACILVLDEDAPASFARLAEADVLVLARSRYSYFAGLISQGAVLYEEPAVLPPGEGWLAITDGSFDEAAFEARVEALCANRL